jgi:hypothetical protein
MARAPDHWRNNTEQISKALLPRIGQRAISSPHARQGNQALNNRPPKRSRASRCVVMLLDDVERIIRERPGLTATQIARALYGRNGYAEQVNHGCLALARVGRIERRGRGGPGDPFTYHPLERK